MPLKLRARTPENLAVATEQRSKQAFAVRRLRASERPRVRGGRGGRSRSARLVLGAACLVALITALLSVGIAQASPLFSDGFESGDLSAWTDSSGFAVQHEVVHDGSWAGWATTAGSPAWLSTTLPNRQANLYADVHVDLLSAAGTFQVVRFMGGTDGTRSLLGLGATKTGKLVLRDFVTGVSYTSQTATIGTAAWHEVQLHAAVNGDSSQVEVWLDHLEVDDLTGAYSLGTLKVSRFVLGTTTSTPAFNMAFDDAIVDTKFIDTVAPSIPTGLADSKVSLSEVDLSWATSTDDVGVTGYTIYRDGVRLGTSKTTAFADKTVAPSTTYSYTIDAYDGSANHSDQSAALQVTTPTPDTTPPTVPTGVIAKRILGTEVDLKWSPSTDDVGVAGYTIYRDGVKIGASKTTSFADKTAAPSTTYSYTVDAFDSAHNNSAQSAPLQVTTPTPDSTPPSIPTDLTTSRVWPNEVDLTWDASTDDMGVAGYTIYRDRTSIGSSTTTSFTDATVDPSTNYTYTVDAYDATGNHSDQSDPLEVTTGNPDTTAPTTSTGLTASKVSLSEVDLSWAASTDDVGVAGYTIYRDRTSIGSSTTTSFTDTTVDPSTNYTYTVDAYDAAANHSDQSDPLEVTTPNSRTPIQHVVIVFQENHSFDNVLGKLCADFADGTITGHDPCDGVTQGKLPGGDVIPLSQEPDIVPDLLHTASAQRAAIDGGLMDGFAKIPGCTSSTNYACYTQLDPSRIPNLAALATNYVISDRTFEFAATPSWAGHMVLASATLDGFDGFNNPKQSTYTTQTGPGWGCDSFNDTNWWDGTQYVLVPSCVPDQNGNGPYRSSPVRYVPTIFDRLDASGLSWKIYGGYGGPGLGSGYGWAICPTFYECLGSTQRNNLVKAANAVTDAQAGNLPNLSIVTPVSTNSQHNYESMAAGDNWIGQVVSAIENGPDWSSTAIFIAYDDCGCFYDHVPPPTPDTGIRVPMVIVSPYAKPGFTDSNVATFMSMLAFTEYTFNLDPLSSADANAYDYHAAFDYSQTSLSRPTMVTTPVSRKELAYIRAHPAPEDDPT